MPEPRFQRDLSLDEELRLEVGAPHHGVRLDAFLESSLPWCSRRRARGFIDSGRCRVLPGRNPQTAPIGRLRPATRVRRGQAVVVTLEAPAAAAGPPAPLIEIAWEDDRLLAAIKPSGVTTHPSHGHLSGSLVERLHRDLAAAGRPERPSPCHRLDRETSGLVLLAKDRLARATIGEALEEGRVDKRYLAVVRDAPAAGEGRIDLPIGTDPDSPVPIRRAVVEGGKPASTSWRVLRRGVDWSLLELSPHTGRQHQLRVHLAAIGHPILGDRLYLGGDRLFLATLDRALDADELAMLGHRRCALHAWRLRFAHPGSGETLDVEAPLAPDLVSLLVDLEAGGGG